MSTISGKKDITRENLEFYFDQDNPISYIGEPTTNLLRNSWNFYNWTGSGGVIIYPDGQGIDGTAAIRIIDSNTAGFSTLSHPTVVGLDTASLHSFSFYFLEQDNQAARPNVRLSFATPASSFLSVSTDNANGNFVVTRQDGVKAVTSSHFSNVAARPAFTKNNRNWYRAGVSFYPSMSSCTPQILIAHDSYSGSASGAAATSSLVIWGAQLEQVSHPTYYVSTSGSVVTRTATGSLRDLSGKNITLTPGAGITYTTGSQFAFIQTGSYIFFTDPRLDAITDDGNSHTFECWVKPLNTVPLSSGQIFGRVGNFHGVVQTTSNTFVTVLRYADGTNLTSGGSPTYNFNQWYHITFVVDELSNQVRTYINSSLIDTGAITKELRTFGTGNWCIGAQSTTNFQGNCEIKIGRVYSRALLSQEVENNFRAEKARFGY